MRRSLPPSSLQYPGEPVNRAAHAPYLPPPSACRRSYALGWCRTNQGRWNECDLLLERIAKSRPFRHPSDSIAAAAARRSAMWPERQKACDYPCLTDDRKEGRRRFRALRGAAFFISTLLSLLPLSPCRLS